MIKKIDITASIVLYNEDIQELTYTINSFLKTPLQKKLFLIDNSTTNKLQGKFLHPDIEYKFNNDNLGFGKAHNLAIDKIKNLSKYHLILNPDVSFDQKIISTLIEKLQCEENSSMIAPKVIFPNGKLQFTARKYPSLFELIFRRLGWFKNYTDRKEYRDKNLAEPFYPEFIHGCFQLYKTEDFIKIGGFDERYFLYMEDIDICRKIDQIGKRKLYYPKVQIRHLLKKESSKNLKLFYNHLTSSIKYFLKWNFTK